MNFLYGIVIFISTAQGMKQLRWHGGNEFKLLLGIVYRK